MHSPWLIDLAVPSLLSAPIAMGTAPLVLENNIVSNPTQHVKVQRTLESPLILCEVSAMR